MNTSSLNFNLYFRQVLEDFEDLKRYCSDPNDSIQANLITRETQHAQKALTKSLHQIRVEFTACKARLDQAKAENKMDTLWAGPNADDPFLLADLKRQLIHRLVQEALKTHQWSVLGSMTNNELYRNQVIEIVHCYVMGWIVLG